MKEKEDIRNLQLTLGVYIVIFILKIVVYSLSGVVALFAEALHTLTDIFISGFLLIAALYSRKKADREHMFGHGRAQNVAAMVAATIFISFTSFELYREAIPRLFIAHQLTYQNIPLVLVALVISMIIAGTPLVKMFRQKSRGAAVKAQFNELINDELGLLAALLGTLFIVWKAPVADPIAAILVATIIAINAVGLLRENISYLLGRSPKPEVIEQVKKLAYSVPGVKDVHKLLAEYVGPDTFHVELHVRVARGMPIEEADQIGDAVLKKIHEKFNPGYCIVRVEPVLKKKSDQG